MLLPRAAAEARAFVVRANAAARRGRPLAHPLAVYVRAAAERSTIFLPPTADPKIRRFARLQVAGRHGEAGAVAAELAELSRAAGRAMLTKLIPPKEARAMRAVRRARETLGGANLERSDKASRRRAAMRELARQRPGLSARGLRRVLIARQAPDVPSVRTLQRYLCTTEAPGSE
jgi:hypothetical protein